MDRVEKQESEMPQVTAQEIKEFLMIYRILARPNGPSWPAGKVEAWLEALSRR